MVKRYKPILTLTKKIKTVQEKYLNLSLQKLCRICLSNSIYIYLHWRYRESLEILLNRPKKIVKYKLCKSLLQQWKAEAKQEDKLLILTHYQISLQIKESKNFNGEVKQLITGKESQKLYFRRNWKIMVRMVRYNIMHVAIFILVSFHRGFIKAVSRSIVILVAWYYIHQSKSYQP